MNQRTPVILLSLLSCFQLGGPVAAQIVRPTERISQRVDDAAVVTLPGNTHPLARTEFDRGVATADLPMNRMILLLAPDENQKKALENLLDAQQDPQSPEYQRWLTPEDYGQRFGAAPADVERIVEWVQSHGFDVEPVAASRRQVIFSGTAAQVQSAFGAEIHRFSYRGREHYANASNPQIPAALATVVSGIVSLNDFHSAPMHGPVGRADSLEPEYTASGAHYMAPADFATIYDVAGLYSQSIDGTGQSIAVAGRSDLNLSDVQSFRNQFGLSANQPAIIHNGAAPGILSINEQGEATLDVEWAGAVAKNASVKFVVSASTTSTDGVALSSQYIVNQNLAPVMTLSFGSCEAALGAAGNQFWNSLWQQAAAEGITVLVASGDSGAAGCDDPSSTRATQGAGVNGLCTPSYSTCVGGTQFSDTSNPNAYWSVSNSGVYGSALSYIPEAAWNASGAVSGGSGLWSGSGGASQVYAKPSWQTGPGVPADGHRDVPDVALASSGHDGYLITMNGATYIVAGTSASTPSFGGLMVLAAQKAAGRLGNVNSALFSLAAKQAAGGAAVFHDITTGNNSVPGLTGFNAGLGYDLATGLGSVDATLLVNHWKDVAVPTPALQLNTSATAVSFTQGSSATVTLTVSVSGGFNSTVSLASSGIPAGLTATFSPASLAAPGSGVATLKLSSAAALTPGVYNVTITASGGGLSQSAPLAVTILSNCTYTLNPTNVNVPASGGNYSFTVTTQTGCSWTAATTAAWIALGGTTTGKGNATVTYSIAANTASARTGAISLGGSSLPVTQAAPSAVFTLNPVSATFPITGRTGTVAIAATPGTASWTASSTVSWISITGAASGTGSKTLTYSVASNSSGAARSGSLVIAGITFTVSQAGPAACSYQIGLGPVTTSAKGYVGSVSVLTQAACKWTASSNASWLTITAGSSGAGSGSVSYLAAPNSSTSTRTGVLTVAGFNISLTEGGVQSSPKLEIGPHR